MQLPEPNWAQSQGGLESVDEEVAPVPDEAPHEMAEGGETQPNKLSVAKSLAELRRRRQSCARATQFAVRVLSRHRSVLLVDGMEFLTRPLEATFNREVEQVNNEVWHPIQTRFRYGSAPEVLNLASKSNS